MCTTTPLTQHKGECCRINVSSSIGYDDKDKDKDRDRNRDRDIILEID